MNWLTNLGCEYYLTRKRKQVAKYTLTHIKNCMRQLIHTLLSCICCTLRSGLHEIPTMIRTFPCGLENTHACKWISDNFPGMLTYVLFLENCQKSICMHGSQIHEERS